MPYKNVQVYANARVYTADNQNPSATAFAVKDGRFIYVGDDAEARKFGSPINLNCRRVLPGFIDSHAHPVADAALNALNAIEIPASANVKETLDLIAKKSASPTRKGLRIIVAKGITNPRFKLTAKEFDTAVSDRPAIILTEDCHAGWMNTKALEISEITRATPDPVPGVSYFERDQDGNPTGFIVEATALYPLIKKLGICDAKAIKKGLPPLLSTYAKHGYTGCIDVGFLMLDEDDALHALSQMIDRGELRMHYFTSYVYFGPVVDSPQNALKKMLALRRKYNSEFLRPNILKLHIDGTLELASAWMFDDYCVTGKGKGAPLLTLSSMLPVARLAANEGFDIHVHAIGDKAISEGLSLMESLGKIKGTKTIAHCQIFPADGVERFEKQGDIFMQTTANWLNADDFTMRMLGPERYEMQVPIGSMVRAIVPVTFSSDSIGGEMGLDPFFNIYHAVQRKYDCGKEMIPPNSEGISLKDAIDAYTINCAKQANAESEIGSISVGKYADFVILNKDPFLLPAVELKTVRAEKTFFCGNCIFDAKNTVD